MERRGVRGFGKTDRGEAVRSYIVRIYGREAETGGLVGVVEDAETRQSQAFHTPGHLVGFLRGADSRERRMSCRLCLRLPVRVWGTDSVSS
jgi:hypothetical protein